MWGISQRVGKFIDSFLHPPNFNEMFWVGILYIYAYTVVKLKWIDLSSEKKRKLKISIA